VADLVRSRRIATQDELLAALRAEGFDATQATLSRDLARLGARRVSDPAGGTRYELSVEERRDGLDAVGRLVASVSCNGSMVVVRTHPGSAPAVARSVDLAQLSEILGTIAGDDTVFIAPAREQRARALADRIRRLFAVAG
jgi:transcriptional regulator of arginine metabolism